MNDEIKEPETGVPITEPNTEQEPLKLPGIEVSNLPDVKELGFDMFYLSYGRGRQDTIKPAIEYLSMHGLPDEIIKRYRRTIKTIFCL